MGPGVRHLAVNTKFFRTVFEKATTTALDIRKHFYILAGHMLGSILDKS